MSVHNQIPNDHPEDPLSRPSPQDLFVFFAREGFLQDVREYLSLSDVNLNAEDAFHSTALIEAAKCGHAKVLSLLCQQPGISFNYESSSQEVALVEAAKCNCVPAGRQLLSSGAYVNVTAANQDTPLHCASRNNSLDFVIMLLSFDANPHMSNSHGKKPIDLVTDKRITEVLNHYMLEGHLSSKHKRLDKTRSSHKSQAKASSNRPSTASPPSKSSQPKDEAEYKDQTFTMDDEDAMVLEEEDVLPSPPSTNHRRKPHHPIPDNWEKPTCFKRIAQRQLSPSLNEFYDKMTKSFIQFSHSEDSTKREEFSKMLYCDEYSNMYKEILDTTNQATQEHEKR